MSPSEMQDTKSLKVMIIGAGVGGLMFGMALKKQLGFEDFTIYEKGGDVGGTWRDNTYPGCSSDIPIHFYSLSSELNPHWKKSHGTRAEIQEYWKQLAEKYSLYPRVVFNTKVLSADWDASAQLYRVVVQDLRTGNKESITAQVVVSAVGCLEDPRYPDIKGLSTFKGEMFHSARWDHGVELRGKTVGVIGNGCSATQFLPIISEDPNVKVVNFCRTPNWYVGRQHIPYTERAKWAFAHIPFAMRLHRDYIMFGSDLLYSFFQFEACSNWVAGYFKDYILRTAPKKYHDKVIPNFAPGCKRTIIDTNYLGAMSRPNVDINWDGISEITESGIVTKKGETIPLDVIILATGYTTDQFSIPVRGINGLSVQDYYESKGGPTAYLGTTVPGFPNFYIICGPNTVTGHSSVIFTEEVQVDYCIQLVNPVIKGTASSFEVTPEATDAYNDKIQARLANSVYMQCVSWYRKGGTGKVTSSFPGPVALYWWYLLWPNWSHYKAVGATRWVRQRRLAQAGRSIGVLSLTASVFWASTHPEVVSELKKAVGELVSVRVFTNLWETVRQMVL